MSSALQGYFPQLPTAERHPNKVKNNFLNHANALYAPRFFVNNLVDKKNGDKDKSIIVDDHMSMLLESQCFPKDVLSDTNFHVDIIVARYAENLSWLKNIPIPDSNTIVSLYIYNKGCKLSKTDDIMPHVPYFVKDVHLIELRNVGRCDHTYLYHVVNNYDCLADVTIFLTASANIPRKWAQTIHTIRNVFKHHGPAIKGHYSGNVRSALGGFTIESHMADCMENRIANPTSQTTRASTRPFGLWYSKYFNHDIEHVCYLGILSAHRFQVHMRPKEFYMSLVQELSVADNVEVGHFIERSWFAIFTNYPKRSIF